MPRQTPILMTPGPITAKAAVHDAMRFDHNPGDRGIADMTRRIRDYVLTLGNAAGTHECVPLQGSATYGTEAVVLACVPADGKVLVVNNGFYGVRARDVVAATGRAVATFDVPGFGLPDLDDLARRIDADPAITHVLVCQVETGTGALNPAADVAKLAQEHGKGVIVDAVAAFGALPLDIGGLGLDAVVASPNKCLEGVPGIALPILRRDVLAKSAGRYGGMALDLHARWRQYEQTGCWTFTAPTHVVAALDAAIGIHAAEGGAPARLRKYRQTWQWLVDGMRQAGIAILIPDEIASPIVVTFHRPADPAFAWEPFFEGVKRRGYWLFNGKLTQIPTFRIGCMGSVGEADMAGLVAAVDETLLEMGVRDRSPAGLAVA
ncbi:MAG TPA: 2-aminoethylphosphonate--pyruvate transaminase [Azospirillaceae bacterium]|nr:2-aminoethylphosphonate--pyruvate transaminase [Azospirillaceae bacterium]